MRLKALFKNYQLAGASILVQSSASIQMPQVQTGLVTPTYGPLVEINCSLGDNFYITVSNNVAFSISVPLLPPASGYTKLISICIANGSGGAHGAITWTAGANGFRLAGALPAIANLNQRSILFRWDFFAWHEVARTAADVLSA